jgi:hypothetical protein
MCEIVLFHHCLSTVSHTMCPASPYVRQHPHDVLLDGADVGFDRLKRPRRRVAVEETVEVDFAAQVAHPAVVLGY